MQAGIRAADPGDLVSAALSADRAGRHATPVWVIAVGKASEAMARAAAQTLGDAIHTGLVITPNEVRPNPPFRVAVGEHPQPGVGSETAGRLALEIARTVPQDHELLVLVSGGASSLMAVPAAPLTLDEKRQTTAVLLRSGADIYALNTVRKHLSAVKGGRLAAAALARCRTLVISDVVGDDLSFIGSGPTVPDPSSFADAHRVIERFGGTGAYPRAVVAHLDAGIAGRQEETPKPGDARLARSVATVIGGRADAMRGAAREAEKLRYRVAVVAEPVVGESRVIAPQQLARMSAIARSLPRPACVISSGETTVTVTGQGRGGRNQEFALAVAGVLAESTESMALASVGTDGVDGPTDAAGALVDSTTVSRAAERGLRSPTHYLEQNDSYSFFDRLGDLIRTGPTGTNVDDLQVLLLP